MQGNEQAILLAVSTALIVTGIILYIFFNKSKTDKDFANQNKLILIFNFIFLYTFLFIILDVSTLGLGAGWDASLNSKIDSMQSSAIIFIMNVISNLFDTASFIIIVAIFVIILYELKRMYEIKFTLVTILSGVTATFLLKFLIQRPRPENGLVSSIGFSFPSAHTTMVTIFIILILFLFWNEIKTQNRRIIYSILSIVLITLVGFSRLYLNVHWFRDVLGGVFLGLFWVSLLILIFEIYYSKKLFKEP